METKIWHNLPLSNVKIKRETVPNFYLSLLTRQLKQCSTPMQKQLKKPSKELLFI